MNSARLKLYRERCHANEGRGDKKSWQAKNMMAGLGA